MLVDQEGLGLSWEEVKSRVVGAVTSSPVVQRNVQRALAREGVGLAIGRELGCSIAAGFEDAIPRLPLTGKVKYGPCPAPPPQGTSGLGAVRDDVTRTLAPTINQIERVTAEIAEPRIKARLLPWFIALPVFGLALGLGAGYVMGKRKKKHGTK
jgi:hypothetical protein